MSDEKKKRMCPDPDCKTETDSELQFCSKCGIDIDSFFTIDRALTLREKIKAAEDAKNHPPTPPKRKLFGNLAGRK